MRIDPIKTHFVSHMWEAYARKLLTANPSYFSKHKPHNKVKDFYIYKLNSENKPELVTSYAMFRKVVEQYFNRAKHAVIRGMAVNLVEAGRICAKRIERDFRSKTIPVNWAASKKYLTVDPETGKKTYSFLVRYNNEDYCRIGWFKPGIKNDSVYEFVPTGENGSNRGTGFKPEFKQALDNNPFLRYKFLFCPINVNQPHDGI